MSMAMGEPERLAGAHAGEELNGVFLDLHAPPAAVALLASRELDVHVVGEATAGRRASLRGCSRVPFRVIRLRW
jgi:hypothetical protein